MAKISDIVIEVKIGFWDAIKLRIAGIKNMKLMDDRAGITVLKKENLSNPLVDKDIQERADKIEN